MHLPFDFLYQYLNTTFFKTLDANVYTQLLDQSITEKFLRLTPILNRGKPFVLFHDQEPIDCLSILEKFPPERLLPNYPAKLLINSEHSHDKDFILDKLAMQDVHYFYHALVCSEWYRNYRYFPTEVNFDFTNVFISFNHLSLDKRLHRTNLLVELAQQGLLSRGLVSYKLNRRDAIIESANSYTLLPSEHRSNIINNVDLLNNLTLDETDIHGALSATINVPLMQRAFVSLVTETAYYENKVHLTEKIFKPIVAKMPFLVLAGAGNLDYLRSYGFKTFGDYWDESYDNIKDNSLRFAAVLSQLKYLANLPHKELVEMKKDMQNILEHNHQHFYTDMRTLVVNEFVDNLATALDIKKIAHNPEILGQIKITLTH